MSFLNGLMLIGLAAVVIPPLVHLFSRRRYEVVDWGAMQFLQISSRTRRRLFLEEVLLMLLRMGLIAILVLALAAPFVESTVLARLAGRPNRDVVLVFDGSYSMGQTGTGESAQDAAKKWASAFLDSLIPGDSVAVLCARQDGAHVLATPTHDMQRVREVLGDLPKPRGSCDWPAAVQAATGILARSQRPERDVVLLGDNQRYTWADDSTLLRWELFASQLGKTGPTPRMTMVNLAPERPADPANWTLAPLKASRAVASAGQRITFRTALELRGQDGYRPPHRLRLRIDDRDAGDLAAPPAAKLERGQVTLSFTHRFATPGSHLVSILVEPDPPAEQRAAGYVIKDHLPGDNRQDLAIEVLPALPVLLVDGDERSDPPRRGIDFVRDALSPARDPAPVVRARVVGVPEFDADALTSEVSAGAGRPRVLVLANVARLTTPQREAVETFLAGGGGVLVALGERAELDWYNEQLFRSGRGWLPARLEKIGGDEANLAKAPSPLPSSFLHPSLELFRDAKAGGLDEARLPRWWKVTTPGRDSPGVPVALLTNNDPLLVERSYQAGRVLLSTVPLDASWRSTLPELPAFAPLAHELIYYLAGARSTEHNVQPGQPLRYRIQREAELSGLALQPPEGEARLLVVAGGTDDPHVFGARLLRQGQGGALVYENTRDTGVYQVRTEQGQVTWYVVQPDARESDLAPCSTEDRSKVSKLVPVRYEDNPAMADAPLSESARRQELWWLFLVGVVLLLCGEVWLTRRIVCGR